jgi:sugar phosphate isomerase/epimerase
MTLKLSINTVGEELEASADYCRSQGIGIEVTDFAFARNLDADIAQRVDRHRKAVVGIAPVSSHGPFMDLIATSLDPAVVEIAKQRHTVSLNAANEIGATIYVAHTNFNPLIREASYRNNFTRRSLDFWLPLADWAARHKIVICLENVWEPGPEIQAELISTANHPNLKATFDNGHALLFTAQPASVWIESLGAMLAHCHLHDNSGATDEHKSIGEGKEDWPQLIAAIKIASPEAILVAESDRLERNQVSVQRLRALLNPR